MMFMISCELSYAIGALSTDPNGNKFFGTVACASLIFLNPVALFYLKEIRRVLSQMRPSDIIT